MMNGFTLRGFSAACFVVLSQWSNAATITPQPLQATVAEGQELTVTRQVVLDGTGPAASKIDIYFLADNTGSMGGAINNVRNNAKNILDAIAGDDPRFTGIDVQFGVASYNGDPREFGGDAASRISRALRLLQPITASKDDTQLAINQWRAGGGGDGPEANFFALHQLATNGGETDGLGSTDPVYASQYNFGWRDDARRLIVWFGDVQSHTTTVDLNEVIAALQQNNVFVAAINTASANRGIDTLGEAQAIVDATQGYIAHNIRAADQTVNAILNSVQAATQSVDLQLQARNVPAGISVAFACASAIGCDDVAVGESRDFTMTITGHALGEYSFETFVPYLSDVVSADSVRVRACLNDVSARGSRSKISVTWADTGADSYNVYRSLSESGDYTLLGNTTSRYATFGDRDVSAGATYFYQVKEVDAYGQEFCASNIAEAATATRFTAGPVNMPPVIISSPVLTAEEDSLYRYDVLASDPEGLALDYVLTQAPSGMTISAQGEIAWTPVNSQVGLHTISVLVSDNEGLTTPQTFTVDVTNSNDAPTIVSTANLAARVGEVYRYAVQGRDDDFGDVLSYELLLKPSSMSIDATTGLIEWTPVYGDGPSTLVTVEVRDLQGASAQQSFTIVVDEPNRSPSITSVPVTTALSLQSYSYTVEATDPDAGDTLRFQLTVAPDGMTIDANTGLIEWTPANAQVGRHTVTVTVEDASGAPDAQTFEIDVTQPNGAPEIISTPVDSVVRDQNYSYSVMAADAENDTLTFALTEAPAFLSIDSTGTVSGLPTLTDVGDHPVTIEVSDGISSVSQVFTLTVLSAPLGNSAPRFTSTPVTSVLEGDRWRYTLTTVDDEGDAIAFRLVSAPAGVSLTANEMEWSTLVNSVGNYSVSVEVIDAWGASSIQSFTVSVTDNGLPVISSTPTPDVVEGNEYVYAVVASDPENRPLIYSLENQPAAATISATGLVRWPTEMGDVGQATFDVRVADHLNEATIQTVVVNVLPAATNSAPVIVSTPTVSTFSRQDYAYNVNATDADGDSLTFELTQSPAGMSMNVSSGEVRWSPTDAQVGDHVIEITVSDGQGGQAVQRFTLTVQVPPNTAPVIESSPIVNHQTGQDYVYQIVAMDAEGDSLSFTLINAPALMNLSVDGLLTWSATDLAPGNWPIAIEVNDGTDIAIQSFTLVVTDPVIEPPIDTIIDPLDFSLDILPANPSATDDITIRFAVTGGNGPVTVLIELDGNPLVVSNEINIGSLSVGIHSLMIKVDSNDESFVETQSFQVGSGSDALPPTANISSEYDETVNKPVSITGTATDENFAYYRVMIAERGSSSFAEIDRFDSPVTSGMLLEFDPTLYPNGTYDLLLEVVDLDGNTSTDATVISLETGLKAGEMSFTVTDLELPNIGMPISVYRSYDSRKKHISGDFGHGWNLSLTDFSVSSNQTLGQNWYTSSTGGFFPTLCIQPVNAHYVTIARPDGKVDKFNMVLRNNCSTLIPPTVVDFAFEAAPGTFSTLVANEPTQLRVSGGNTLLEQGFFSVFDPSSFTLTGKDGTSYTMTRGGALTLITDRQGNRLTFNTNGITHSNGQSVSFNRDAQGRIQEITDPSGNTLSYLYDGAGNLARAVDRNSNATRYLYNRSHAIVEIRDPLNRPLSQNVYDDSGRLIAIVDGDGNRTDISSNAATGIKTITSPDGVVTTIEYDVDSNPIREVDGLGNTTTRTFNEQGLVTSETDPLGNTTVYDYDTSGNVISETNALGETITRTYDSFGNLISETDANGNTRSFAYDDFNNKIGEVDANGVGQIAETDASGFVNRVTDSLGRTTTFTRNGSGQALTETEPNGNVISYAYDENGNQVVEQTQVLESDGSISTYTIRREFDANGNPVLVTDALGFTEEFEYDNSDRLIGYTNKNGYTWAYDYDVYGNRTAVHHPDGTQELFTYDYSNNKTSHTDRSGYVTTYVYDNRNNKIEEIYADGSRIEFEYDSNSRLTARIDEVGSRTEYDYDALNRKTTERFSDGSTIAYVYDASGNVVSETDQNGNTLTRVFDSGNRLTQENKPDGSVILFSYDTANRVISEQDGLGNTTTFEYDSFDRLTSITDALGNTTSYTYSSFGKFGTRSFSDERGALAQMTYPDGRIVNWDSDVLGRVTSETRIDGSQKLMAYDGQGNMTSVVDFNGHETQRTFNAFDQLVSESFADGRVRTYTYSGENLIRVVEDSYWTEYQYDARGRLVRSAEANGSEVIYDYDLAGRVISTQAGTESTSHVRDYNGRIIQTTHSATGVTTYAYDLVGNLVSQVNANGTYVTSTYDELNRLTSKFSFYSDGRVIDGESYRYDLAGNLVEILHHDGRVQTFIFDDVGQLISEDDFDGLSSLVTEYAYNVNGDRTLRIIDGVTESYTYDLLGRMVNDGSATYIYDSNGNLISNTGVDAASYEYDSENRLVGFTSDGLEERYFYNYRGTRISKTSNGEITRFWIDQLQQYDQVLLEFVGTTTRHHVYGVGRLATYSSATGIVYYHADAKNSVVALTDSSENLLNSYQYDAWGEQTFVSESIENDFRFNGEALDDSGLYYLRARYYSSELGRFTTPDAFDGINRIPLTQNQYTYGLNNPVVYGDPSGNIVSLIMRAGQISRYANIVKRINMLLRYQARGSVKQLRALKRSKKGIWRDSTRNDEIHHVVEKRFMRRWGIRNVDDTPGAVIPREYHRIYTNRWRQAFPYGSQPSRQQVLNKVYDIYRDDPMMLREALRFLL